MDEREANSLLTGGEDSQRKVLTSNVKNTQRVRKARQRIRQRVREGLRDFEILANHLEERDREKIFEADPFTEEYDELQNDVAYAIEFLYAGMGGEANFRRPLKQGVARGEAALGNVDYPLDVEVRFDVKANFQKDSRKTVQAIEAREWDALSPRDLFGFIRIASDADAIDFSKVREQIESRERTREKAAEISEERAKDQSE